MSLIAGGARRRGTIITALSLSCKRNGNFDPLSLFRVRSKPRKQIAPNFVSVDYVDDMTRHSWNPRSK